ncbi:hypothetical protein CRYUN_Cryun20dG0075000 [Craigia yunnanensis]
MSGLIEGLLDAVALRCLAWFPFYLYPKLELVSHSWRAASHSPELLKLDRRLAQQRNVRHLAHFCVVSTGGKLFVLGGESDDVDPLTGDQDGSFATDEVWSYDPILHRWAQRASMILPRVMFACCVLKGKIIVAVGFTSCRKSISQAEMYDPEKDVWIPIPDLHRTHNSACSGLVIGGKDKEVRKVVVSASEFRRRIGFAMTGLRDEICVIGGVIGPDRLNWDIKPMSDVDILTVGGDRPTWRQAAPMTKCRGTIFYCTQQRI